MDVKMAQRDEMIADLEYELMVIRTEIAWALSAFPLESVWM